MRIGLDFDNTIACYDGVFHAAALARGLIPADLPTHKTSVRDYLDGSGRKQDFTELQGYVYGARMDLAQVFPGFMDFVDAACAQGHDLFVVSHKSATPLAGPAYDLRAAAKTFMVDRGLLTPDRIDQSRILFEATQAEKISRIATLCCDVFIDDLPDVLLNADFPAATRAILFDPDSVHIESPLSRVSSWTEAAARILATGT